MVRDFDEILEAYPDLVRSRMTQMTSNGASFSTIATGSAR
jgi:hypothetical protein